MQGVYIEIAWVYFTHNDVSGHRYLVVVVSGDNVVGGSVVFVIGWIGIFMR